MRARSRRYIQMACPALMTLLASCANLSLAPTTRAPPSPLTPSIVLKPCHLFAPGLPDRLEAECGTLTVFEDRAAQSGRQVGLHVAVRRAASRNPEADPLFFLAGGPGQSAAESFVPLSFAFTELNRKRDIILVDQRGTGQSNPLHCPAPEPVEVLAPGAAEALAASLAACRERLDADVRFYTTAIAMQDLDQVRAALGYDRINLYGVSYGTRAALTYLRQYPGRVRTMILDGVAPPDIPLGLDTARNAQRALDLIFVRCTADPDCRAAFPGLRAEFDALAARLKVKPVTVALLHPITGVPTEMTLTYAMFARTIHFLSYAPETVALLPLLVHAAYAHDNFALIVAQTLNAGDQLAESLSEGMSASVLCAEDFPFYTDEQAAQANADTYLGSLQTDQLRTTCATWPRGEVPADVKEPVTSDVPALLLSGEADPVTPPANGERAARTLPNSLHLIAPEQGHNVIGRGCLAFVAASFVARGGAAGLDVECVQEIRPIPFFVNFAGPPP